MEIQKFIFPTESQILGLRYFAKWTTGRCHLATDDGALLLDAGTEVDFAHYVNALRCNKWRSTRALMNLGLRIVGHGRLSVRVREIDETGLERVIAEQEIDLSPEGAEIPLGAFADIIGQSVGVDVEARTNCRLSSAGWTTNDERAILPMLPDGGTKTLQNFIFPDEGRAAKVLLYCQWQDSIPTLFRKGKLLLPQGGRVDFTSFFNTFSHRKWTNLTLISNLQLRLAGKGRARLEINAVGADGKVIPWIDTQIDLSSEPASVDLGNPGQIPGELVALMVTGLEADCFLSSASWATRQAPQRDVRLAAVVTTFRRESAALDAAHRFATETIPGVAEGALRLYVIDNGQSINPPELPGVIFLPNRNLGGAGGFTRGLLEAMDTRQFTHVLFMDDDASCEPESVWRSMALLAYAQDPALSISGAMLLEDDPYVQYEKGASLQTGRHPKRVWIAQLTQRDLSDPLVIAANDLDDRANYGGWWFFAFPLSSVKHLPFPFFVRGDDTDFSLKNRLPVVTLNGIASWCGNFAYKLNPPTEFLAWRSWLALSFMYQSKRGQLRTISETLLLAFRIGRRFDYASMAAVCDAMELAAKGPEAFGDAPSPLEAIGRTKSRVKPAAISPEEILNSVPLTEPTKWRWRALSALTLGGHLLPTRLKRTEIPYESIAWMIGSDSLVRFDKVVVGKGTSQTVLQINRSMYLSLYLRALVQYLKLRINRKQIARRYRAENEKYRSRQYWQKQLFGEES